MTSSPPLPLSLRERGNSLRPPSPERRGCQGMRPLERVRKVGGGWGGWWRTMLATAVACTAITCTTSKTSTSLHQPAYYFPARDLGPLFTAVELSGIFPDSKTFVDARPLVAPAQIVARYDSARRAPGFSLQAFVQRYFEMPPPVAPDFHSYRSQTMEQHIRALWPVLTRAPSHDTGAGRSSLIPLPEPYVVPGGRFREVYYWDSYFTMLGLIQSGRTDLVASMLDNFAYLVRTVGHIPNGNRTYYLGRSQPPYFAAMVGLYAGATDTAQALRYLDALEAEHAFWMDGAERLAPGEAYRRVVKLRDGSVLNRYWDDGPQPRPESFREDYELGQTLPEERRQLFYRNVRATGESGWDFSSRWMRDPKDLRPLETTALVPVDRNCLLYRAERIVAAHQLRRLERPQVFGVTHPPAREVPAALARRTDVPVEELTSFLRQRLTELVILAEGLGPRLRAVVPVPVQHRSVPQLHHATVRFARGETLRAIHPERVLRFERIEIAQRLRGIRRARVEPDHGGEVRGLAPAQIVRPVAVWNVPDRADQVGEVVQHAAHQVGPAALNQPEHGEIRVPVIDLAEAAPRDDVRLG